MDESATARYRSLIGYTERGPCPVSMECTFAVAVVAVDRRDRMGRRRHFIIAIIIVGILCIWSKVWVYVICSVFIAIDFLYLMKQINSNPARDMDIVINYDVV